MLNLISRVLEKCMLYSKRTGENVMHISEKIVDKSYLLVCEICGQGGAVIVCGVTRKTYHLLCASRDDTLHINMVNFASFLIY